MKRKANSFICASIVTSMMVFIIAVLMFLNSKNIKVKYKPYIVGPGETLWSISVECNLDQDIRETVWMIQDKNKLDDVVIYPGQELLVPVAE